MLRVGSKLSGTSPQQFKQDQDILKVQITGVVFTATPFLMAAARSTGAKAYLVPR